VATATFCLTYSYGAACVVSAWLDMWLVCRQGDNVWIDPSTNGEFDVAIGARVKAVDGENICLVDDDNKVACRLFYCYIDDFNLITNI